MIMANQYQQGHRSRFALAQRQLLSKPSELRLACDAIGTKELASGVTRPKSSQSYLACSCRPLKRSGSIRKEWHYSKLTWEIRASHHPTCPLYMVARKQQSIRLRYRTPGWLLGRLVEHAFTISTGAGGFAISPSITVVRVVDRRKSPAFRIVQNILQPWFGKTYMPLSLRYSEDAYIKGLLQPESDDAKVHIRDVVQLVSKDLQEAFCAGSASLLDVDENGLTILHVSDTLGLGK